VGFVGFLKDLGVILRLRCVFRVFSHGFGRAFNPLVMLICEGSRGRCDGSSHVCSNYCLRPALKPSTTSAKGQVAGSVTKGWAQGRETACVYRGLLPPFLPSLLSLA
jgi:hypothetical protein